MDMGSASEPVAQLAATCGTDASHYTRDRPGLSAFALEDGTVHHTYSAYARGLDGIWVLMPGSTARRKGGTKRASGGDDGTSTTGIEPSRRTPALPFSWQRPAIARGEHHG